MAHLALMGKGSVLSHLCQIPHNFERGKTISRPTACRVCSKLVLKSPITCIRAFFSFAWLTARSSLTLSPDCGFVCHKKCVTAAIETSICFVSPLLKKEPGREPQPEPPTEVSESLALLGLPSGLPEAVGEAAAKSDSPRRKPSLLLSSFRLNSPTPRSPLSAPSSQSHSTLSLSSSDPPLGDESASDDSGEGSTSSVLVPSYTSIFSSEQPRGGDAVKQQDNMRETMLCTQLHAQRLPILAALLRRDLEECDQAARQTNAKSLEYEARHRALLDEHGRALQLTFELINEKIRLSGTIPALLGQLSSQLGGVAQRVTDDLEASDKLEPGRLTALRQALGALESAFVCRDVLQFDRRALELKFEILEQEAAFLKERVAYLQQAQADVVQKFNAVAQAQTLTSVLVEKTDQLAGSVLADAASGRLDDSCRTVCGQIGDIAQQLQPLIVPLVGKPDQTVSLLCHSTTSSSSSKEDAGYTSIPELVARLTDHNVADSLFQKHFLMTYRYFLTPVALVRLLVLRFLATPPPGSENAERYLHEQKPVQIRVMATLKVWLDTYPEQFADSDGPSADLTSFLTSSAVVHYHVVAGRMLQKLEHIRAHGAARPPRALSAAMAPPLALTHPSFVNEPDLMLSFDRQALFSVVSPLEAARQLSLHLHEIYADVRVGEFFGLAWSKAGKEQNAPNLMRLIADFNGLSAMVVTSIVECRHDFEQRCRRLDYFVQTAVECYRMNNLHATVSIVSGLQSTPVYRLKQTWAALSPDLSAQVADLIGLLRDNNKLLRERVNSVTPPCIPYIGVYLTDLTFLDEGNPTFHDGLVNFRKCRMIAARIDEFLRFNAQPYVFDKVSIIRSWLTDYAGNISPTVAHQISDEIEPKRASVNLPPAAVDPRKGKKPPLKARTPTQQSLSPAALHSKAE